MRERRIDYKTRGARIPLFRRTKVKPRVVTEEEKKLWSELGKLERLLDRIEGKEIILGKKLTPYERKLKRTLPERIKAIRIKLVKLRSARTVSKSSKGHLIPEKE